MFSDIFTVFFHTCRNTINFKSRASRKEYFYYYVMLVFISLLWLQLQYLNNTNSFISTGLLFFKIFIWISGLSLNFRRLHDANFSGKWYILYFVLFFILYFFVILSSKENVQIISYFSYAIIILQIITFYSFKGTPGSNKYGDPPEY